MTSSSKLSRFPHQHACASGIPADHRIPVPPVAVRSVVSRFMEDFQCAGAHAQRLRSDVPIDRNAKQEVSGKHRVLNKMPACHEAVPVRRHANVAHVFERQCHASHKGKDGLFRVPTSIQPRLRRYRDRNRQCNECANCLRPTGPLRLLHAEPPRVSPWPPSIGPKKAVLRRWWRRRHQLQHQVSPRWARIVARSEVSSAQSPVACARSAARLGDQRLRCRTEMLSLRSIQDVPDATASALVRCRPMLSASLTVPPGGIALHTQPSVAPQNEWYQRMYSVQPRCSCLTTDEELREGAVMAKAYSDHDLPRSTLPSAHIFSSGLSHPAQS